MTLFRNDYDIVGVRERARAVVQELRWRRGESLSD